MNLKEEAKRIVELYEPYVDYNEDDCLTSREVIFMNAKQCALIYVDGMRKASIRITNHLPPSWCGKELEQYKTLKEEIKKLNL